MSLMTSSYPDLISASTYEPPLAEANQSASRLLPLLFLKFFFKSFLLHPLLVPEWEGADFRVFWALPETVSFSAGPEHHKIKI